jgi:hypothetical protein
MVGDFGGGVNRSEKMYSPDSEEIKDNALYRELCEEMNSENKCEVDHVPIDRERNGIANHIFHQIANSPNTHILFKEELHRNPAITQKILRFNAQLFVEVKWSKCKRFLDTFRGNKEVTEVIIIPYSQLREYLMGQDEKATKFEVLRDMYQHGMKSPQLHCSEEEEKVDPEFCTGIKVIPYDIPYAKNAYKEEKKAHKVEKAEEKKESKTDELTN